MSRLKIFDTMEKPCNTCASKKNIYDCPDQKEDIVICIGDYVPDFGGLEEDIR